MKNSTWGKLTLLGAAIAAMAASLCCVGPLVLLTLGISGAWISVLTHMEFLRPISIIVTLIFLVLTFWKLYISSKNCANDKFCEKPTSLYIQRIIFWIIAPLLLLLLAFPWYAFLFC